MRAMLHDAVIMCQFFLLRLESLIGVNALNATFIPYPFMVFCGGLIWRHMDNANKQLSADH